jgi:hypothetical protein
MLSSFIFAEIFAFPKTPMPWFFVRFGRFVGGQQAV